jgi:hypothetical protein
MSDLGSVDEKRTLEQIVTAAGVTPQTIIERERDPIL